MHKQNGNTLLEILLVLAVSSVLIVLAIRYFTVVDLNVRVAEAISKIDIISRASYEWQVAERKQDFSGIKLEDLKLGGFISNQESSSPWGGDIGVAEGEDRQHVKITIAHINAHACQDLRRHLLAISYNELSKKQCRSDKSKTDVDYWGEF